MLTCFYGAPEIEKRVLGYEMLRYLSGLHTSLWLVIGDFNEILSHHEEVGGAQRPHRQITLFQDALYDCQLSDLSFFCGKHNWSNNRHTSSFTKEKLDIAIASKDWISAFGDGDVQVLSVVSSGHLPILLTIASSSHS